MQLAVLMLMTLLTAQVGSSLVCYSCGKPGLMSCEDAFSYGLVLGVPCEGVCVATSFKMRPGTSIMSKWCDTRHLDVCAKSRDMNFDTCATCTTSFCNGPLPSCDKQLKFLDKCVTSNSIAGKLVLVLAILGMLVLVIVVCVFYRRRRTGPDLNTALIAKYYGRDVFRKSVTSEDLEYTKL